MGEISIRRALGGGVAALVATGLGRVVSMLVVATALGIDVESTDPAVRRDGLLLGVGILGGCLTGGLALYAVARPAHGAALALARPTPAAVIGGTLAALGVLALGRGLVVATGLPAVEPEWLDAYRTGSPLLLGLALVTTSIFEELYFRGLLQTGLARTRVGTLGAIAIPTTLFVAAHAPGDAARFVDVLLSALVLAAGRHVTKSSLTMIPGHVIGNLVILGLVAAEA